MEWSDIRYPVIAGLTAVILPALMWLVNRKSRHLTSVQFGPAMLVIAALIASVFGFFAGAMVFIFMEEGQLFSGQFWLTFFGFVGFSLLSAFCVWDGLYRKARWDEGGLEVKSIFKSQQRYKWSQIKGVGWKSWAQGWKITFDDKSGFLFFDLMRGSQSFIDALNQNVDWESVEK